MSAAIALLVALTAAEQAPEAAGRDTSYTVVVSKSTQDSGEWKKVVDALVRRHKGRLLTYDRRVDQTLEALREQPPRFTCFVATPPEVTKEFIASVHRLTRKLDADPYTDTIWGILTAFDAPNALRIASRDEPLVVRKVISGTEIELDFCEEGAWYCELKQHRVIRKARGGKPVEEKGPADTTRALVDALDGADLFITSGHATEHDWQIGYAYRNGQFVSKNGELFGIDTEGNRYPIRSSHPKVYLPVGNCLMGHIDGPDAMALAFMNSAGVHQMIGYTVPTWYGYAGWGCLDYFLEQPGRYTFAEAFFANEQALIHRLETCFPDIAREEPPPGDPPRFRVEPGSAARKAGLTAHDAQGLLFDRDVVAFYGDPAWEARMADSRKAWEQTLTLKEGTYTLEIRPLLGERSFDPASRNGSQRGGRPFFELLPHRIQKVEILEGGDLAPIITDDFVLVPHPGKCDPTRKYRVVFHAERVPTRV